MTNAKQSFLDNITGKAKVKCATVHKCRWSEDNPTEGGVLKVGYTEDQYHAFLKAIDFEFNSGYGGQEVFGTIWLEDGNWFERGEYDGSEWWEYKQLPEIPIKCLN